MESPTELIDPAIPVTAGIATASRPFRDGMGKFLKWSHNGNPANVLREYRFLTAMADSGVTPKPIGCGADFILMEDLGDPTPVPDDERALLIPAAHMILGSLVAEGIRHNDLRPQNLMWRDGKLYCFDFGRATWYDEPLGEYRANEDAELMRRSIALIMEDKVWT